MAYIVMANIVMARGKLGGHAFLARPRAYSRRGKGGSNLYKGVRPHVRVYTMGMGMPAQEL